MSSAVLRQMFEEMVVQKDPAAIERCYDPSFVMFSNGGTQNFDDFAASHRSVYATEISYSVEYDEDAWGRSPEQGRRIPRWAHHPCLGDHLAELEHPSRVRDVLIEHLT
jgi:hypothetical protein